MTTDEREAADLRARLVRLWGEAAAERTLPRLRQLIERWRPRIRAATANADPRRERSRESPFDERDVVLIAYGDHLQRPGQAPLVTLTDWCKRYLHGLISTVHVLPFHPSTSYEGYAITDYLAVDPTLGEWRDLEALGERFGLMMDLVLNHCSASHPWFQQFLADEEPGRRYFITVPDPEMEWLKGVYRARDLPLTHPFATAAGERHVWTTYSPDLIDTNWREPDLALEFLAILLESVVRGARVQRLDAFGYAWKAAGTTCVNQPENHELVRLMQQVLAAAEAPCAILPSITNTTQAENFEYFGEANEAREADLVYHLPLSGLLLHTLYAHDARQLTAWIAQLPDAPPGRAYLNLAASHDGVGLTWLEDLLAPAQLQHLVAEAHARGSLLRRRHRTVESDPTPWELNCTYFSACATADDEPQSRHLDRFLATQGVVVALRGVPALYLSLLVGGTNDYEGVKAAGEIDAVGLCQNRKINRGRFPIETWESAMVETDSTRARLFRRWQALLRARVGNAAFHPEGAQRALDLGQASVFALERTPPGGGAAVLCLTNFAGETVTVPTAGLLELEVYRDLLTESCVEIDDGAAAPSLDLAPYQTLWLTPCEPTPRCRCVGPEDAAAAELRADPRHKVVHLFRHGQADHQLRAKAAGHGKRVCRCFDPEAPDPCPFLDPALTGSALTERGQEQAAGKAVGCDAELVLVSPMMRSLQTLLAAYDGEPPPAIALEPLRAMIGPHGHSRRLPISELAARFPTVDFSRCDHDADVWWHPQPESRLALDRRAARFLRFLFERPEREIAVFTHFTNLMTFFFPASDTRVIGRNANRPDDDRPIFDCSASDDPEALSSFLEPGELRTVILVPERGLE